MNNRVDYSRVVRMLEENDVQYETISLCDSFSIIACASGGRLFGPFKDKGESVLWLNAAFLDEEKFSALLADKNWNIGGERFWIAPELAFFVKRRKDFDETYVIQTELDPGKFKL